MVENWREVVMPVVFTVCILGLKPRCVGGTTDPGDANALEGMFGSFNSPPQLSQWVSSNGDPCGQSWKGVTCAGQRVTAIKLSGLGLSGSLQGYQLQSLTALTELDLSKNSLAGQLPHTLPPNLQRLNLDTNQFTQGVPYWTTMTSLQYINLGHNQLQGQLSDIFGHSPSLTTLDVSFNSFTGNLPQSFGNLTSITSMYLENNQFNGTIDDLANLPLETLNIANNRFTGWIPEQLKRIDIWKDGNSWSSGPAPPPPLDIPPASSNRNHKSGSNKSPSDGGSGGGSKSGIGAGGIAGIIISIFVVGCIISFFLVKKRSRKSSSDIEKPNDQPLVPPASNEVLEHLGIGPRPKTFSYTELSAATDDFSPSNKLGEGGFGPVYKGKLSNGWVVAVKQLLVASHQGKNQFVAEIATISAVQHRNLVKLYGWCIEGNRCLLVYEYLENKSLDQALFGNKDLHLDWPTRFSICMGTARGLAYLHEESRPRIIHRDVKASNILIDAELCPKISDFGLAKLYDDKKTHISTRVAGTIGYLAPEYAMCGHLTEKADVFGFGVVALEILSGRPNSDNSQDKGKIYLLEWAWTLHENNQSLGLVDPTLVEFDENEALRMIRVGLLCTQAAPKMRPAMSRVVAMLAGDIKVSPVASKPSYLIDWDFSDKTASLEG
ncbi:hypothetical protein SLA2020_251820 [Shorea laevis]